jgi:hypothetical protein
VWYTYHTYHLLIEFDFTLAGLPFFWFVLDAFSSSLHTLLCDDHPRHWHVGLQYLAPLQRIQSNICVLCFPHWSQVSVFCHTMMSFKAYTIFWGFRVKEAFTNLSPFLSIPVPTKLTSSSICVLIVPTQVQALHFEQQHCIGFYLRLSSIFHWNQATFKPLHSLRSKHP